MAKFRYDEIRDGDGIRLIMLHPRRSQSPQLQCSLIHTTLSKYENELIDHYTALSYVWGDSKKTCTVSVNNQDVDVTANLYAALKDLQDENRVSFLWADALCINQADLDEKGRQVALMGRIYASAQHTVIYMGDLTPASEALLKHLSLCSDRREDSSDDAMKDGVRDILERPWFYRVWVFQELVLSRDPWIQCGRLRVRWNQLYDHMKPRSEAPMLRKASNSFRQMHEAHVKYKESLLSIDKRPKLGDLVATHKGFGAADPRDMIYAFLGVASEVLDPDLAIDYKKSCVDLYIDFACCAIRYHDYSRLLSLVSESLSNQQRMPDLPSWVPDWSSSSGQNSTEYISRKALGSQNWEHYVAIREPPVLAFGGQEKGVIRTLRARGSEFFRSMGFSTSELVKLHIERASFFG
ncbi:uncharacterized protein KY384_007343 [Bacidia gigantensis]|uniref:uncharacterized protein n=1 Tax=Bacidia gigantensis TaxID=2732470 RepID=UPI001D053A19|nr:uncharacterized protein KY384_007343 [Bacidia gigantensis]KAG8528425.1 hypothetical protein KY384_007343 [Bacidia gigantensis]